MQRPGARVCSAIVALLFNVQRCGPEGGGRLVCDRGSEVAGGACCVDFDERGRGCWVEFHIWCWLSQPKHHPGF